MEAEALVARGPARHRQGRRGDDEPSSLGWARRRGRPPTNSPLSVHSKDLFRRTDGGFTPHSPMRSGRFVGPVPGSAPEPLRRERRTLSERLQLRPGDVVAGTGRQVRSRCQRSRSRGRRCPRTAPAGLPPALVIPRGCWWRGPRRRESESCPPAGSHQARSGSRPRGASGLARIVRVVPADRLVPEGLVLKVPGSRSPPATSA